MKQAIAWILMVLGFPQPVTPQAEQAAPAAQVRLRVAGAQIPVGRNVAANAAAIKRAIVYAAREKADVLVTPEGSLSGYTTNFDQEATARALTEVVREAREAKVALALGTCFQEDDGQRYDEIRFYAKDSSFLGFHAKILLCRRVSNPKAKGELDYFKTKPLATFRLEDMTVGGLICNDMWANPEYTPQDDPHLAQQLSKMGARVVLHSVNAGQAEGEEFDLVRAYHEANLRLRARAGKLWIVVADAADPNGRLSSKCPSGVLGPDGRWAVKADPKGEQFFAHTIEIEN